MLGKTRKVGRKGHSGADIIAREGIFEEAIELGTLKKLGSNMKTLVGFGPLGG